MKKLILIFLAVLVCFSALCGCAAPKAEFFFFGSDNGYSVYYPARFTPNSLSHDIDFVIMDERTGSTVSVQTTDKSAASVTEEEFISLKKASGIDINMVSFEKQTVNDLPAIVATYSYNQINVTEIIYEGSEFAYSAVYTELPGISEEDRADMISTLCSLAA